jgi:hypothetical protein
VRGRILAGWRSSLQALGGAFGELAQAELAVLGDDFSRSGRRLGGALLLLAAALFGLFWAIGLTVYLAVEVATRWLPRWGAVAAVLAVVLLVVALLAAIGRRRLRRLEGPSALLERRWASHRDWWQEQFPTARPGERPGGAAAAEAGAADEAATEDE